MLTPAWSRSGPASTGSKHPLGVVEGSTENATVVTGLLAGLRDRGLDVTRPILIVIDGAKALAAAVKAVFDHPVIGRCQLHKIRNVENHLPDHLASTVAKKMRAAYHDPNAVHAEATLEAIARDLQRSHPGAAASLREGLAETLTVTRLGVAAHAGPHAAVDERHRVDDRDRSRPLDQREALAGRADGAALVRRRHARSQSSSGESTVPASARPARAVTPTSAEPSHPPSTIRNRGGRLTITGPARSSTLSGHPECGSQASRRCRSP